MTEIVRLFCGFDQREAAGWHVFAQSVIEKSSIPVAIVPISMDAQRDGTNAFTYSRFLIPYLCDFQGWALWADGSDMLANADIAELWAYRQGWYAVQVAKHDYKTKHRAKYVGTEMEAPNADYPRKNWSSVILWDCGHYMNRVLTPEFVQDRDGSFLHRFGWLPDDRIGELPKEWNWLPGEHGANPKAKLFHFTEGLPSIHAYRNTPHAQAWRLYESRAQQSPEERIAEMSSAR